MSQLITASRLHDGAVVFLGDDGAWVERLDQAMLLDDKDAVAHGLAQGSEAEAMNLVVDVYAIDVLQEERRRGAAEAPGSDPGPRTDHPPGDGEARLAAARRGRGRPCIGMTNSTPASWRNAWRSSATRSPAASRAN